MNASPSADSTLTRLRAEQVRRWVAGERPPAEEFLARHPELAADAEAAAVLVYGEALLREELDGTPPDATAYAARFPEYAALLMDQFELHGALAETPVLPGFAVERELGRGGMGVVYLARDDALGRPVAVKVLLSGAFASESARRRFRAEAASAARLQHPHIVAVHAVGEYGGRPYLVMEYVAEGGLDKCLAGTPLVPRVAAELLRPLADAIEHAHRAGVVHRDLKPANVLLADGLPKVADFGLAKRLDDADGPTFTNQVLGTPSYMAPEQAAGAKDVGSLADVYALGAILYECLTGRPPFKAATPLETLAQVTGREPAAPRSLNPAVPRDLETVCLKCLAKEPARRYQSAAALGEDLTRFLNGQPVLARPVGPLGRAWRLAKRKPALAGLSAALAVVIPAAAAGTTALYLRSEARGRESLAHRRESLEQMSRLAFAKSDTGVFSDALHQACAAEYARLADAGVEPRQSRLQRGRHLAMAAYDRTRLIPRSPEGERIADEAVAAFAALRTAEPDAADVFVGWLDARFRRAYAVRWAGRTAESLTLLGELAAELPAPSDLRLRALARDVQHSRAAALSTLGRTAEASAAYGEALRLDDGTRWVELTVLRACMDAHGSRPAEAAAQARGPLANPHLSAWRVFNVACCFAVASQSPALPDADREALAAEAVATLRRALAGNPVEMRGALTDPDLAPLRGRADFQALLADR